MIKQEPNFTVTMINGQTLDVFVQYPEQLKKALNRENLDGVFISITRDGKISCVLNALQISTIVAIEESE